MNSIKQLRSITKLNQSEFGRKYNIALKTIQNWEANTQTNSYRKCPVYVYELLKKQIIQEYKKEYISLIINNLKNSVNLNDCFINSLEYGLNKIIESKTYYYIKDIILYGSTSRNEMKKGSDIDLLIEYDKTIVKIDNYQKIINTLKGNISTDNINDPETDLHVVYDDSWRESKDVFYRNISKDGVSLWN